MATSTTNLGLTKPAYSDDADIADINDNMDILDAKIGAVGNTSVQNQINSASASISANAQNIGKLKDDVAITEDGDTATHSISTGQYVIWKGDMYKATQNIAVSATLSSSNLDSISSGVSNDLGYKLSTHNHDDRYYTEGEIDTQIGTLNQALQTHNHDDRYYTESEIDTQVAGLNARIDALDPEQGVGIFTDVAFSIPLSSWTASNNVWTYTYVNPVITARSGIDVIYDSSYRTAMKGDVDIVKNTGNIVFTTNRQPVGSLSGTVRVFDSVQGVLTTDKGGTGGTTAQAARENLGIYANNIQMSSSDNTSVSSAIDTNSTAIAKLGFIEELGAVSNLNITNRTAEKCYHMVYEGSATGSPPSAAGGHSVLYVNSNTGYGSQVAFSNGGSFFRILSANTYSDWNRIALKEETDFTTITATLDDCTGTITTNECRYKYLSNNVLYVTAAVRGKITAVGNPGYAAVKLNNLSTTGFSAWRVLHSIREAAGCFVNTPYSIALDIQSNYIKAIFESSPGVTSTKWQTTDSFYIMFSLLLVK